MSGHTHIHTHRTTTVTLAAHVRRGLITTIIVRATPLKWLMVCRVLRAWLAILLCVLRHLSGAWCAEC